MSFVHLHVHSEYSLLEAALPIKKLAAKAAELQMPAVALTDNGNMFGAIEFYFACKDKGVKPLIGLDAYMAPGSRHEKKQDRDQVAAGPRRLVLLAQNLSGYRNLCKISTIGYQEGFYWKPRIDFEVLQKYQQDIICLTGSLKGEVPDTFLREGPEAALQKIRALQTIFGDRLYLETCRMGIGEWSRIHPFLVEASKITGVPLVATNDVHYLGPDDQLPQEVLICIGSNKTLSDESRYKLGSNQFYLKSPQQMQELFADIPDVIKNSLEIAERCNVNFRLKDEQGKPVYHLPTFPTEEGRTLKEEIAHRSLKGLEERFVELEERGEIVSEEGKPTYYERLSYELNIIDRMGFNGYFLIVQDFINWAKERDIPVGPGRGSGAGSLVAYSLKITDLDPVPNFLLFERFLNPERISMPDFDIDFCQDRRQEVIQYVTQKYGQESVAQIITYGKLQARAAIKDVGRVLGMTFAEVDIVTKLIPEKLGINLKEALELEPRISELMESNPTVSTLMDLAQRIEGMVRHAGIHAAGVIIADGELVRHSPLYKGSDGEQVVQYDMKHAEKIGLIKFDFLGLKTLTHIHHALKLVEKNRGKKITTRQIPMNDEPVFQMMSQGDTAGVFQFEGEGITEATRKIRPSSFADITAITSLYRPGPMANIPEFTDRKHGKSPVEYLLPETEKVLSETYGIMVYQEQVMGIASLIAGYSLGEADMLRRAMGKKIKEEMDRHRERFMRGALEKGHPAKASDELFDLMYKFADYGFNKSHAAAYSVVTLQTAWLKCHYPVEFFAALLSTELSDTDKIVKYSKDAAKHKIQVNPPHVNFSSYLFDVNGNEIYFGLGAIKGVGEGAVEAIVEARNSLPEKKFKNLDEFFNSVDLKKLNKKVLEALIKAGAFEGFGYHRAQLLKGYPQFMERAQGAAKDREVGQRSFFDWKPALENKVALPESTPWGRTQSLAAEKEVLGFYLSDHPLRGLESLSRLWSPVSIAGLAEYYSKAEEETQKKGPPPLRKGYQREPSGKKIILLGLLSEGRELITKKGTRMAFAKLEDLSGTCELVIFPEPFLKNQGALKEERPVLVQGYLEIKEGAPKVMVDLIVPLEESLKKSRRMILHLSKVKEEQFSELMKILLAHAGGITTLELLLDMPTYGKCISIESPSIHSIHLGMDFVEKVFKLLGSLEGLQIFLPSEGI